MKYQLIIFDWSGTLSDVTYGFSLAPNEISELLPDVKETLQQLSDKGYQLAIATMLSESALARELEALEIGQFFVATRTASQCHSKPHPQMIEEIIDFCGVEVSQTLMVGDTLNDLLMARNAGVGVAMVTQNTFEFEDHNPQFVMKSVAQLPELLCATD